MRKIDETDEGRIERRERDQGAEKVKKEREKSTKSATGTPEQAACRGTATFPIAPQAGRGSNRFGKTGPKMVDDVTVINP